MTRPFKSVDSLAIFSRQPSFPSPVHVGRPNLPDRQKLWERINSALDRRWLSNEGPLACEFERKLEELLGVRHCIATCNGTVALEIAIRGLGLKGEVIVPSFTFVATPHSLQWQEIKPVFCDIDPVTHCIDPSRIEELITPQTTGIIGVHLWGDTCDVAGLERIASDRGLRLMFDASHAFGCSYRGSMIGNFGAAEIFSFHATKFINTFEGGAIATNDDELAGRLRLMKNFGFAGYDNVIHLGINGKMHEISAAMGLGMLEELNYLCDRNESRSRLYRSLLAGIPGLRMLSFPEKEKSNYQYVVLEIDERECGIHRDTLLRILHAENVLARRYFYPGCHRMEPYRSSYPDVSGALPVTEAVAQKVLVLPTGPTLEDEDVETIAHLIRLSVDNGPFLQEAVRALP